jgi:exodeoxyribonuclease-3
MRAAPRPAGQIPREYRMPIKLATWNINSVRLRMPLVEKFVKEHAPDILCLQETKCRDAEFPRSDFHRLGFEHVAIKGQKGYHGLCIASRFPFAGIDHRDFCEKGDARHLAVTFAPGVIHREAVILHNFYIPAGGDEPDPAVNPKFAHKLAFLEEMAAWFAPDDAAKSHAILVGDFNVAPLETDVWSHKALLKVVSHTPIEVEKLAIVRNSGPWVDVTRTFVPSDRKVFTWWSYRSPDWAAADKGRRLDHIWTSPALAPAFSSIEILKEARGWERPSDHVPLMACFGL